MILDEILNRIFYGRTGVDFSEEKLQGVELLGKTIKMSPISLVLVFLDLEDCFNVSIPSKYVLSGYFRTYEGIRECIENLILNI